ncbi:DUF11 domain-containing protein [Mariniblastus fucicola]|uniref:Large cysteine-rich periplasmic protein omcB n=1 Tax=Mariniblastus fucicola TaxID=980251 RepID=A0A5B9PDM6_9BACT|nr:DUF11 domain-containing protein [Mariniblastus fucicola]QEG23305.1 Large cysteine-rich periplasmic protein omcB precursor [Mariniblastus fucicola]
MLAQRISKIVSWSVLTLLIAISADSLLAQDQQQVVPPSQRYEPAQAQTAPPSVHIAPGEARRLPGTQKLRRSLSDQSLSQWSNQPGTIAQTSYQQPAATQEPAVPAVLAGAPSSMANQAANGFSAARSASASSVERFASQVNQMRTDGPDVSPIVGSPLRAPMNAPKTAPPTQVKTEPLATSQNRMAQPQVSEFKPPARPTSTPKPAAKQTAANPRPAAAKKSSDFAAKPAVVNQESAPKYKPTQRMIDRNVRPVSRQVESLEQNKDKATMSLNAPGIEVETFGPQTIGLNKPASFRVEVNNNSRTDAENVLVGINVPEWVDVQNTNLTTGKKEITGGQEQARILWTIDRIPAGQKHTATVVAVPRKAQGFGLSVEWTLVPRMGSVDIQVTEPRLEMMMSGPGEVLFGETAVYTVTVRNPGTGMAENVVVMLPEEFGGDRAAIGNIPAGKESTFDIELAARTAGQLTLTTNASADGNLATDASQDVVVRRAVLGITIEGPALKYSGTMGRYKVTVTNNGDAAGNSLETAIAFPQGANYLGGIDGAKTSDGGILWQIGSLDPNQSKTFEIDCELVGSGDLQFEAGVRHKDDPTKVATAAAACVTAVETIADLVLTVQDPKGPLPTGEETDYQISVQNRGSRSAKGVELLMQFSEGIEPSKATGLQNRIVPGQVIFAPIAQIDPGQSMTFKITAIANKRGTHVFRAFLSCDESDSREVAEGTTKFFGDEFDVESNRETATANQAAASNEFKR